MGEGELERDLNRRKNSIINFLRIRAHDDCEENDSAIANLHALQKRDLPYLEELKKERNPAYLKDFEEIISDYEYIITHYFERVRK